MTTQPLPLTGIRVIDYSHFLAGPFLSRCLAAMGADVIKVERPTAGDAGRAHPYFIKGQSGYFLQQNMGKRGLCINLKDPRGLEMMHKLTDTADVFVENYRPGALEKLGLGYAELSSRNPKLVYCSVSAYGHTGPDSAQPGFGLIAEAKSGAMAMIGVPGEPPPLFRIALADMYTGIHGVAAVCAALLGRVSSGRGQHIDMALYDTMVSMHEYAVQCYTLSGGKELPVQTGHDLPQSTVYGVFAGRDGYFVIAAQVDDAWKRLAEADRRRCARRRRPLSSSGGAQRASRGDPGEDPRLGDGAALGQGVHRRARRGRGAVRQGAEHRRGARRSADHRPRHDRRAGSSGARPDPPAQPAVPVFRMRHFAEERGAAARPAQPGDRREARVSGGEIDAMVRDGVLYAEEAVAGLAAAKR